MKSVELYKRDDGSMMCENVYTGDCTYAEMYADLAKTGGDWEYGILTDTAITDDNGYPIPACILPEPTVFQLHVLEAYLGEYASHYDVDSIIAEATYCDYKRGVIYWVSDDSDFLGAICEKHELD